MKDLTQYTLELKTERLNLRPLKESDTDVMWPYVCDPSFPIYMSWKSHTNIEQTKKFLREKENEIKNGIGLIWGIFQENVFCGVVGLHDIQWSTGACETGGVAEIGYWLAPEVWGKGLMPEAGQAILEFGFETINLRKIKIGHISNNTQSRRVIEKLGFRFVGEAREHWKKNGVWYDHKNYEMLRSEFEMK